MSSEKKATLISAYARRCCEFGCCFCGNYFLHQDTNSYFTGGLLTLYLPTVFRAIFDSSYEKKLLLLFLVLAVSGYAQEPETGRKLAAREPFIRMYLTGTLGIGFPWRHAPNPEIMGGPLTGLATLPLRFPFKLFLIPEVYGCAFRSPKFPNKEGWFGASYPRYRHQLYGVRIGRSFAPPDNGFSVLPSVGIDYLRVEEPHYVKTGGWLFPTKLEYEPYHLYSIPMQLDLRFQNKRDSYAAFVLGMRYNKNDRRSFGSISAGVEFDLNESWNIVPGAGYLTKERRLRREKARFRNL